MTRDTSGRNRSVDRRKFLKYGGAASAGLMAGCLGDNDGDGTSDGSSNDGGTSSGTVTGSASEQVTIRVIRPGTPSQVKTFMEPAIEQFENENPNINVEPIYQGWSGYFNRLDNWVSAGEQPHVVMLNDYLQPEMLDRGVPLQRADIEDRLDDEVAEQNVAYDTVSINDGEHYVVPACVGSFIYYYRKDNFEEAGLDPEDPPLDTYDDLFSTVLPALQENTNVPPIGVPLGGTTGAVNSFWTQFYGGWTGNKSWLDSVGGEPLWTSDAAIEGTEQYKRTKEFAADSATSSGRGDFRSVHIAGDVSIHFDGPWIIPSMTDEFGEDLSDSPIGFSLLPEGPSGRGSNVGMDGWTVMRDENVDAAFKLVNKLASKEIQTMHDKNYGCVPARQDEAEDVEFFQNEPWPTLFDAVDDGLRRLYHPNASEVNSTMMEQLQSYWVGNTSAQDALETVAQNAQQA